MIITIVTIITNIIIVIIWCLVLSIGILDFPPKTTILFSGSYCTTSTQPSTIVPVQPTRALLSYVTACYQH